MENNEKMPILSIDIAYYKSKGLGYIPEEVPMMLLNEDWAQAIHGQSLQRLKERGGMCYTEVVRNIVRIPLNKKLDEYKCIDWLKNHIKQHYIRSAT